MIEPLDGHVGYEFVDKIVGGVIPQGFRPAVDKGIQEALQHGELAGAPVQGVRVTLVDGSYHNVDSSEMAFKIAGSMAFRSAYEKAEPTLLEPIMELEVTVPDESVGAINGDLNSRRGRLHGMEPKGGMTTIKAEVPMAEVLTYNQALVSLTGGRGDYHMQFLRYEEVPAHIAQKLIERRRRTRRPFRPNAFQAADLGKVAAYVAKRSARDWFLERRHLAALRRRSSFRPVVARLRARAQRASRRRRRSIETPAMAAKSLIKPAPAFSTDDLAATASDDWITNGGSLWNQRYSSLDEINASNVSQLKGVWLTHLRKSGARREVLRPRASRSSTRA